MSSTLIRFSRAFAALALVAGMLVSSVPAAAFAQVADEPAAPEVTIPAAEESAAPEIIPNLTTQPPAGEAAPEATAPAESTAADSTQFETQAVRDTQVTPATDGGEFDSFNLGTVNGQGGWKVTNASFDQSIVENTTGPVSFGTKALRFSNSYASGSFGDQMFAKPLTGSVGENSATAGTFSAGVRDNHFEMSFDFASTLATEQPGLSVNLSPDRGDGSRMSFIRLTDTAMGITVAFNDVQGGTTPAFVETVVKTGLDRTVAHNVKLIFDAVNGPSNDVVKVYVDGVLAHTGTSWEDYYRYAGVAEPTPRIVKTVLFRANTATPTVAGNGFLFDHVMLSQSGTDTTDTGELGVVVRAEDLETETNRVTASSNGSGKWFFYNDENDAGTLGIDNALGSFVTGPGTTPAGAGSVAISVTGTERRNIATYRFAGTKLSDIETLKYSTYNSSTGNGASASANRAGYLQFNVSFDGNDTWQRRLSFVPANNVSGSIDQDSWKEWDAINNGNARWTHSGSVWPGTATPGTTPKTWSEILEMYPNAKIRSTDGFFGIRVGEPYADGYTENIDAITFATVGSDEVIFDFETTDAVVTNEDDDDGRSGGSGGSNNSNNNDNSTDDSTGGTVDGGASTGGQVLGASTYNFTANLTVGSTGADVTALQAMLIASGDLAIAAPTGYFGEMTRAALAKWQAAHGVQPAVGYFGPLTRAAVASASTPASTMTQLQRLQRMLGLLQQVLELQKQLEKMNEDAA